MFSQALQPIELTCLRWSDVNFAENTLSLARNRGQLDRDRFTLATHQLTLSASELHILQQLAPSSRTTDWLFASKRHTSLSERSIHHLIQQAGTAALPFPVHPYMLRRSGLFYRSALLLQPLGLSRQQCTLLWQRHGTLVPFSQDEAQLFHL